MLSGPLYLLLALKSEFSIIIRAIFAQVEKSIFKLLMFTNSYYNLNLVKRNLKIKTNQHFVRKKGRKPKQTYVEQLKWRIRVDLMEYSSHYFRWRY